MGAIVDMSLYEVVIPSPADYFRKFGKLDELDLKIIFAMAREGPDGPRNISRIASKLKLPKQTVNFRVHRFDRGDLVRFRAILDEPYLGLANYTVIANVRPDLFYEDEKGKAINAGTFLTCYPVWRYLAGVHGTEPGFFVVYSIPPDKESDLRLFLDKLTEIRCIKPEVDFLRTTQEHFNNPLLNSYIRIKKKIERNQRVTFDWRAWTNTLDKATEADVPQERSLAEAHKVSFTYEDLLVLFHLEQNLRSKFVDIARSVDEPSSKVSNRYREILQSDLIRGCRFEVYPIDPTSSVYLTLKLELANEVALRKLISHLNEVPYPISFRKVIGKNTLFLHAMIPPYEYFDFTNALAFLSRHQKTVLSENLYRGSLQTKFINIGLYETFSKDENKWAFSKDVVLQALDRLIVRTGFEF